VTTEDIFVASPEGFRSQNIDRPAEHLVRELVQNSLDEDGVTQLDISVAYHGPRKGTTVLVRDNASAGVKDMKMLFTLWLSDKEDSHLKRGRMGRGFKELVSVADQTVIRTSNQDALLFKRNMGGRWERKVRAKLGRTEVGTEVRAYVRGWGEKDSKKIVTFLKRVRAPSTIRMTVNGEHVAPFFAAESYQMPLETVIYETENSERKARERRKVCTVECFRPVAGEKAFIYEMGIPVEACDGPVSIDVGQRVILRERRDTVTDAYRRSLLAEVLNARIDKLSDADLRDNAVLTACADSGPLSSSAIRRIVKVWTDGKPFAATPQAFSQATGQHIECVNLRALPESIRYLVKYNAENVNDVMTSRRSEFCPPISPLNQEQTRFVALWTWIAAGIGKACTVSLRSGKPSAMASYAREEKLLSVYAEVVGKRFIAKPLGAEQLGVLIHECAHWRREPGADEHGGGFHADTDDVGGLVAAFLLENAEQARLLLREAGTLEGV
jgi:hypothetical protein